MCFEFPAERVSLCSLQIIALKLVCQFDNCYKICPCCWVPISCHPSQGPYYVTAYENNPNPNSNPNSNPNPNKTLFKNISSSINFC